MSIKFNSEQVSYLITFMMLFAYCSFNVTNDVLSSGVTIGMWIFVLFSLLVMCKKKIFFQLFFTSLVLALLTIIQVLINNQPLYTCLTYTFSVIVSAIFVAVFDLKSFLKSYTSVMYFLALISIMGLGICLLIPPIGRVFTITLPHGTYTNWVIFVKNINSYRNCGMFWEPGAFQTFLNLALLFEVSKIEYNKKHIVVFVIAILSTFSTTGYIALVLIGMLVLLKTDIPDKKAKRTLVGIGFFVVLFLLTTSNVTSSVFGKIQKFFEYQTYRESNWSNSSASIRYYAIVKPIEAFLNHPLFGLGYYGLNDYTYSYTLNQNTCTFVNWFAMYGILYGIIMLFYTYKFTKAFSNKFIERILILVFLFTITMSENYVNSPITFWIAFYGIVFFDNTSMKANRIIVET